MTKLSVSQLNMYSECSEKWRLKYRERLRPKSLPSPLFFGSALDEAFSHLLLSKKPLLTEAETSQLSSGQTALDIFERHMNETVHNGTLVQLAQNPAADYFKSDFTADLLNKSCLEALQGLEPTYQLVDFVQFHEKCGSLLKERKKLANDDKTLYNYMTWLSLVEKGKLMVAAYERDIMPEIHEVHSIQEEISLPNGDGDEIIGKIDFRASFVSDKASVYTMDNKSSSKKYVENSVQESEQLATYCEYKESPLAGYAVVEKTLYKTAPKIRTQLILDTVSAATSEKTLDKMDKMLHNLELGLFEKKADKKQCYSFGRQCEYYGVCHFSNYENVVKLEKK